MKLQTEQKINQYLDMMAKQNLLVERTRDKSKKHQNKLYLEQMRQIKTQADAAATDQILTNETAVNASILDAESRKVGSTTNLQNRPVKRDRQSSLVGMWKHDQS